MKSKILQSLKIAILLLVVQFPLRTLAQQKDYVIEVSLPSKLFPAIIYRNYPDGHFDSLNVATGKFKLQGKIDSLTKMTLVLYRPTPRLLEYRTLYISSGKVIIKGDSSLSTAKITTESSKEQKLYDLFRASISPYEERMQESFKAYNLAEKEGRTSVLGDLTKKYRDADSIKTQLIKTFIVDHPNTVVALDLYIETLSNYPDVEDMEDMFARFTPQVRQTHSGVQLKERISMMKKNSVMEQAQDFTQPDTSGKAVSLKDFRGKYVLVDFWASWCGPCRVENPNLVKIFEKYKGRNFTILGISLDNKSTEKAWRNAIHSDGLAWTHVSDLLGWNNSVAKVYGVTTIPQNFLIDPQGKIIAKGLRGEDLEKQLKKLLNR